MNGQQKGPALDGIMFVVDEPEMARGWYARLFAVETKTLSEFAFEYLEIGGFVVEFLQSDERSQPGIRGQVGYWSVPHFDRFVGRALQMARRFTGAPSISTKGAKWRNLAIRLETFWEFEAESVCVRIGKNGASELVSTDAISTPANRLPHRGDG